MARQNLEKVHSFRITFADDETLRQLGVMKFTKVNAFVTLLSIVVVLLIGMFCLISFTPMKTFIPGYPDGNSKRAAIQNAIKIDSLESIIARWDIYAENMRRVIEGESPLKLDSLFRVPLSANSIDKQDAMSKDSLLRNEVKTAEMTPLTSDKQRQLQIEGVHFFVPAKGTITAGFEKVRHPYIDITAPANTMVMSVLDGTVIFSGWDDDGGYTIIIQHSGDITSIYKHNQKLLKKTGDKVSAGTPIAAFGANSDLSVGDHLRFELWHSGEAEDPTQYINF